MPSTALDWQSTADLTGGILVALALVYLWLRHLIDGAPTESPRDTIPDLDVTFDPLAPEPFVDAQETLLPLEDPEQIRCSFCGAPLSSLSKGSCWNCSTPNDRSAA